MLWARDKLGWLRGSVSIRYVQLVVRSSKFGKSCEVVLHPTTVALWAPTTVRPRRTVGQPQDFHDFRAGELIEASGGLGIAVTEHRAGGRLLLQALRMCFPSIRLIWADQGYIGTLVTWAATSLNITLQIVRKLADQTGFVVLHRRWAVERTFSWINRCRRTVRDHERRPEHHAAMVRWAMVIIMTRRLARYTNRPQTKAT